MLFKVNVNWEKKPIKIMFKILATERIFYSLHRKIINFSKILGILKQILSMY